MSHVEVAGFAEIAGSFPAYLAGEDTFPEPLDIKNDFFDALSSNDIERAASVFAADGVLLFPGLRPVKGHALVKRMLSIIRRRYTEINWTMSTVLATDCWLVSAWSVSGEFVNTGAKYSNEGVSLIRLNKDGRIAMLSDYFKDTMAFQPQAAMTGASPSVRLAAV